MTNKIIFDLRILELWLSWGENRCDVEFRLKINKQGDQTKRSLEEKVRQSIVDFLQEFIFILLLKFLQHHRKSKRLASRSF